MGRLLIRVGILLGLYLELAIAVLSLEDVCRHHNVLFDFWFDWDHFGVVVPRKH
jgi:hypothetical protein